MRVTLVSVRDVDPKIILCQTRHELLSSELVMGLLQRLGRNTQDAWIWLSPIRVPNADFELGRLGCDGAIAHRFKSAGIMWSMRTTLKSGILMPVAEKRCADCISFSKCFRSILVQPLMAGPLCPTFN